MKQKMVHIRKKNTEETSLIFFLFANQYKIHFLDLFMTAKNQSL